mmetsp:Transcript_118894/g.371742  ORF Transcript_118894/g.371742 Transcript_118894/m.371742 type:complete len:254 (+) Transcript_118894:262-1023(+)
MLPPAPVTAARSSATAASTSCCCRSSAPSRSHAWHIKASRPLPSEAAARLAGASLAAEGAARGTAGAGMASATGAGAPAPQPDAAPPGASGSMQPRPWERWRVALRTRCSSCCFSVAMSTCSMKDRMSSLEPQMRTHVSKNSAKEIRCPHERPNTLRRKLRGTSVLILKALRMPSRPWPSSNSVSSSASSVPSSLMSFAANSATSVLRKCLESLAKFTKASSSIFLLPSVRWTIRPTMRFSMKMLSHTMHTIQ